MGNLQQRSERRRSHNRIAAIMIHTDRYSFKGRSRLARDAGVSKSAISRLLNGTTRPTYRVVDRVIRALEREMGRSLDFREVISQDGNYATAWVCRLMGCAGCLPEHAKQDSRIEPGMWSGDNQEGEGEPWLPIEEIQ